MLRPAPLHGGLTKPAQRRSKARTTPARLTAGSGKHGTGAAGRHHQRETRRCSPRCTHARRGSASWPPASPLRSSGQFSRCGAGAGSASCTRPGARRASGRNLRPNRAQPEPSCARALCSRSASAPRPPGRRSGASGESHCAPTLAWRPTPTRSFERARPRALALGSSASPPRPTTYRPAEGKSALPTGMPAWSGRAALGSEDRTARAVRANASPAR